MLELKDVHFRYSKHTPEVLRGVTLSLQQGEIGILLGRNGAGKSTLFSSVLGMTKPAAGSIALDGVSLIHMPQRLRASMIAYVPQNISPGPLSVYDTVLLGRISHFGLCAGQRDHQITASVLEEMGLASLAGRKADTLSGGEAQKVAIARAIAQEPKLMVFDEPTGSLDLANIQLLTSEVKRLAKQKKITVLCALHDLNTALSLGDRFFFLKDGIIRHSGGAEAFTEETIADVFGATVQIVSVNQQKIILGGNL